VETRKCVVPQSYTLMPIILADRFLVLPLYIILKEPTGTFGPRMLEILLQLIFTSKLQNQENSTSEHFKTWFSEVCLPNIGRKSLTRLVGHCPSQLAIFQTIPKKTTGIIQSLDVFGFRIWKNFARTFLDNIIFQKNDINFHCSNEIIKLQSLTHNQPSLPRLKNLFQYSLNADI